MNREGFRAGLNALLNSRRFSFQLTGTLAAVLTDSLAMKISWLANRRRLLYKFGIAILIVAGQSSNHSWALSGLKAPTLSKCSVLRRVTSASTEGEKRSLDIGSVLFSPGTAI